MSKIIKQLLDNSVYVCVRVPMHVYSPECFPESVSWKGW